MGPGRGRVAPKERYQPQVHIALQHQRPVMLLLRQAEELLAQLTSQAHLGLEKIQPGEALERLAALPRLLYLLTQRVGPSIALDHFRRPYPFAATSGGPSRSRSVSSCWA